MPVEAHSAASNSPSLQIGTFGGPLSVCGITGVTEENKELVLATVLGNVVGSYAGLGGSSPASKLRPSLKKGPERKLS